MNTSTATRPDTSVEGVLDAASLTDAALLEALERGFELRHAADSRLVRLAAEVTRRSRSSLGPDGLASRLGSTSAAVLLADVGRITVAEGQRLCRVADATADRVTLLGERMPPPYPIVADAVRAAIIPIDSANHIVAALTQASPRAQRDDLVAAELALVKFALESPADMVRAVAARWRDALDVDGIEQREGDLVERRSLRRSILANGMKRYRLDLDPAGSAYLDAAIDAQVGQVIRAPRFCGSGSDNSDDDTSEPDPVPDSRALAQIAADAVVEMARHAISCDDASVPLPSATIVVRMTLDSLLNGHGEAQIDGIEQPISAGTARHLAADAHIIPTVLNGLGEVLDFGTSRRLFSKAQRLALAERDGGCAVAGCSRPPSHTEAHHLRWWSHGGKTDLANGILLCVKHHHTVHRDGWGIEVIDNVPWFTPPSSVDVYRRPRRGGRPPVPIVRRQ
ncbi:HNH endonuclease signature motif containing protein [Lacisediminihabitans sp. FW035]